MYIETKEIGPEGLAIDRSIQGFQLPSGDAEGIQVEAVHLSGELSKLEDGLSFSGRIRTTAHLACSRCLEEYSLPLDLPFDLFYTTAPDGGAGEGNRIDDDMVTRVHYDGARIELGALLSEQLYLGLPLKPLCRQDCLGLCAQCGTDLNGGDCACAEERTEDPRLRVLKNLL
jgi:DUF177 domain-containing protein